MEIIEFVLVLTFLLYICVFFVHLVWKTTKMEPEQRKYHYGIAVFLVLFLICRIFLMMNDLVADFFSNPALKQGIFYILGSFFAAVGVSVLMIVVEKYVYKKLRFVPSAIVILSAILMLVLPRLYLPTGPINMVTNYSTIMGLMAIVIPILYLIVGYRATGKLRKRSFLIMIALIGFFIGNIMNTGTLRLFLPIIGMVVSPLTILISLIVFHYGLLIY